MRTLNRTYSMKKSEIDKKWFVVDATGLSVGRLAVEVVKILKGKKKPTYTPHMVCGDHVVILNADKAVFTGKKFSDKIYYRHTGYMGGLKTSTPKSLTMKGFSDRIVRKAIRGMLTKESPLSRELMRHCHIYCGSENPHEPQKPEYLDIAAMSKRNRVSDHFKG